MGQTVLLASGHHSGTARQVRAAHGFVTESALGLGGDATGRACFRGLQWVRAAERPPCPIPAPEQTPSPPPTRWLAPSPPSSLPTQRSAHLQATWSGSVVCLRPRFAWSHGTKTRQPTCHRAPLFPHVAVRQFSSTCPGHSPAPVSAAPPPDFSPGCAQLGLRPPMTSPALRFQVPVLMHAPRCQVPLLQTPIVQRTRTTSQHPTALGVNEDRAGFAPSPNPSRRPFLPSQRHPQLDQTSQGCPRLPSPTPHSVHR